ncbi:hypothetical protein [Vibrio crassostreae]|uniref:hypothetical protein n=1 Tax=Vibrio crassostreae TaxID=246167 RepID=UPI0010442542|nr:hypothetical protein [Vibrio crassostreae]TCW20207.1 hypothetical protein EDB48_104153 [Vibrio crassostreae]CAK3844655.1 hypothetical protein VCRA217O17_20300 [Vibrio crassostreae]
MSKLTIDIDFLKDLKVKNPVYIRRVISSLRGYEESTVVFWITGVGCTPHYEVTLPNGTRLAKNGINHEPFKFDDTPKEERIFNPNNVSRPFSLSELKSL